MELKAYKTVFDAGVLASWIASVRVVDDVAFLWDSVFPIVQEGKRIRGYLAEVGQGDVNGTSLLGLALELLHSFALVHDDIMDRADMRRGHKSVHRAIGDAAQDSHVGQSHAILLGDWLLVESYGVLEDFFVHSGISEEAQREIRKDFRRLLHEMVWGQMMDIELESDILLPAAYITEKTRLKTALYTFVHPIVLGLKSAGASEDACMWARNWGTAVGLGFQVQDDLLDLVGDVHETGKPGMTDVVQNSGTFFRSWIFEHGREEDQALLRLCLGDQAQVDAHRDDLRRMFFDSGAIAAGKEVIEQYYSQGRAMLSDAPLDVVQKECLSHVMDLLMGRKS